LSLLVMIWHWFFPCSLGKVKYLHLVFAEWYCGFDFCHFYWFIEHFACLWLFTPSSLRLAKAVNVTIVLSFYFAGNFYERINKVFMIFSLSIANRLSLKLEKMSFSKFTSNRWDDRNIWIFSKMLKVFHHQEKDKKISLSCFHLCHFKESKKESFSFIRSIDELGCWQ
jgi:hypothetical protein